MLQSNGKIKRKLTRVRDGEHARDVFNLSTSIVTTGEPYGYWTDGTEIYWAPEPNGTYTVRVSGFKGATAATAATDTFPYHDLVMNPVGSFIAEIFNTGVDDSNQELQVVSARFFAPVIEALSNPIRDGARIPTYSSTHRI